MSISIHALREEGDGWAHLATVKAAISIHALREEGDAAAATGGAVGTQFLSTPSARRATPTSSGIGRKGVSISIHALREEGDGWAHLATVKAAISIHALREEGDRYHEAASDCNHSFLSTPSARRATWLLVCFS